LFFVVPKQKTVQSKTKGKMLGTSKHAEWYSRLSRDGIFFFANTCGIGGINNHSNRNLPGKLCGIPHSSQVSLPIGSMGLVYLPT